MSDSSLTIISPTTLAEAKELASTLANANTMPAALKKSPADVLAIVMAGAELGLAPMQSIRGIMLIEGRPTLSADAMGALVKSSSKCEYLQCTVTTDKIATFVTKRKGDPEPTTMSFTIEEANLAGLNKPTMNGKPSNWMKFPKAMLRARAQSSICRLVYSDLMLGVYDPDEVASEEAPRTEKQVASTVETLDVVKEQLRARRNLIVEPLPSPPAVAASSGGVEGPLDWEPKFKGKTLETLSPKQLEWVVAESIRQANKATDYERDVWQARESDAADEIARRMAEAATP